MSFGNIGAYVLCEVMIMMKHDERQL